MHDDTPQNEEELRKLFLRGGTNFFEWNSGKNTPNILNQLSIEIGKLEQATRQTNEAVGKLDASVKEASASSGRLAAVLNRLTFAYVIVTCLGVAVALWALIYQIWFSTKT